MEPPTYSCSTMHYTRQFPRADPNICSRTTLQHLDITLVYSFNLKCIIYKSKKKVITFEIASLVYIKLDPTHARHSDVSARRVIISMLMKCGTIKKKKMFGSSMICF